MSYLLTISTAGADDDVRWFHGPHALERARNAARRAIPNTVASMYAASADGGFRLSARHMMAEAIPVDTDTGVIHGPRMANGALDSTCAGIPWADRTVGHARTATGQVDWSRPDAKLRETAKTNLYAELLVREMDKRSEV